VNDSRIGQMRALIDDARTLAAEMQEEGARGPVDTRRLGSVRSYLNSALSTLDWFDKPYPDERA
jgi:hypothetical protein